MCDFFPRLELVRARPKYPHTPKVNPGGLLVSSINSVHINIYTHLPKKSIRADPNFDSYILTSIYLSKKVHIK